MKMNMKKYLVSMVAGFAIGLTGLFAHAADQTPNTYLGSGYQYATNGQTVTLAQDCLIIPRTNIDPHLTAVMCTNDIRSMAFFFIRTINAAVLSLPSTNNFHKMTVTTGLMQPTVSNQILQTFGQTFSLDAGPISPAGE